jgi:hypothetical protein
VLLALDLHRGRHRRGHGVEHADLRFVVPRMRLQTDLQVERVDSRARDRGEQRIALAALDAPAPRVLRHLDRPAALRRFLVVAGLDLRRLQRGLDVIRELLPPDLVAVAVP